MKKIEKAIAGVLGGAVLAAFLFISDNALAYEEFSVVEGKRADIKIQLPSFSGNQQGYKGVRYDICTRDGTAESGDYLEVCQLQVQFTSPDNHTKYLKLAWPTTDDDVMEDNEDFWIDLTNPEVLPVPAPAGTRGSDTGVWEAHQGSSHVPLSISIKVIIEDNDDNRGQ